VTPVHVVTEVTTRVAIVAMPTVVTSVVVASGIRISAVASVGIVSGRRSASGASRRRGVLSRGRRDGHVAPWA
jgi:hypothetical protein